MAELVFHDARPVLPMNHERVAQFRMGESGVMFQKEPLLNHAAARMPSEVRCMVFMDADVILERGRTALEEAATTLEADPLLVQPFDMAAWCDAAGRQGAPKYGTGWAWEMAPERLQVVDPAAYHTGFAVAMRRATWQAIGGLYGCPITGTGDAALWQAALAPQLPPSILGRSHYTAPSPELWRAKVSGSLSVSAATHVPGTAVHLYHGSMRRRSYDARHKILAAFRPDRDIRQSPCGLPAWSDRAAPELQAAMRRYFDSRAEDE
jgi:hypothetical protein